MTSDEIAFRLAYRKGYDEVASFLTQSLSEDALNRIQPHLEVESGVSPTVCGRSQSFPKKHHMYPRGIASILKIVGDYARILIEWEDYQLDSEVNTYPLTSLNGAKFVGKKYYAVQLLESVYFEECKPTMYHENPFISLRRYKK